MAVIRPDPDKVFPTRQEAEQACERLNREPPEHGYSPWYLGGPVGEMGEWWVIRARGVVAEDLAVSAREYEVQYRVAVEKSASDRDRWRQLDGIEIESVTLEHKYPDTELAVVFRPVPAERFGERHYDCRFGYRVPVWPAEYPDTEEEAYFWRIYFGEFLGTSGKASPIWDGPCDPDRINWL